MNPTHVTQNELNSGANPVASSGIGGAATAGNRGGGCESGNAGAARVSDRACRKWDLRLFAVPTLSSSPGSDDGDLRGLIDVGDEIP